MASIPADLFPEILAFLPVKGLLRFRCVSKSFKLIVDSPNIVKEHLSHSQKTQANLYGINKLVRCQNPHTMLLEISKSVDNVSVLMVNQPPDFEQNSIWEVVGSCNGLVALCNLKTGQLGDYNSIVIWNPLTRKGTSFCFPHVLPAFYGFGYDPKTYGYKLVRIVIPRLIRPYENRVTFKAAVYSFKTNLWKEANKVWPMYCGYATCPDNAAVLVNNALHWGFFEQDQDQDKKIVAFDLVKEELYCLPVLECFHHVKRMKLHVLDGCLSVTYKSGMHSCVWIMKEHGVKESWTKVLSFLRSEISCSGDIYPLAYSKSRNKILLSCGNSCYWYNFVCEKFVPCLGKNGYLSTGVEKIFTGSLVSLRDITSVVWSI